ncbi:Arylsulfatase A [Neorhodopirellula lusitana]|uniref:Arylsulfatase A n=1 Tax=Neorhodopirellula lusitana TaxID=445327 RepID=A0ABY1PR89_9BACT|nr:arylsulfatase [Neorhodopirellula lusitana]SMP43608.1 Arylsulfatase A [Neorhodopirellula lusitana]
MKRLQSTVLTINGYVFTGESIKSFNNKWDIPKSNGYRTAMIGKWHLGMSFPEKDKGKNNVNWKGRIEGGPTDRGFDYYFGISASLDMPPYIYVENNKFVGECTTTKAFNRKGPAHEDFEAVNVLDEFADRAVAYIQNQTAEQPFFTYVALNSPHTPILPSPQWQGKSELGAYGDFQMQTDAAIGRIVDAVDAAGLSDNTLIIVSSDNGCSKAAKITAMEAKGHFPSAQFRGSKADIWDGGHRVPFIARWPRQIQAGTQDHQLICLTDLIATCAEAVGTELSADTGEDSVSFLPALKGQPILSTRDGVVHHSISGHFAYRVGNWKLVLAKGSGGWTSPKEDEVPNGSPQAQRYEMNDDPGETTNLYESRPEIAARLLAQLESDVKRGRSTSGPDQANDTDKIRLWKSTKR